LASTIPYLDIAKVGRFTPDPISLVRLGRTHWEHDCKRARGRKTVEKCVSGTFLPQGRSVSKVWHRPGEVKLMLPPWHRPGKVELLLPSWHRPGKVEQVLPPRHRPGEVEQVLPACHGHRSSRPEMLLPPWPAWRWSVRYMGLWLFWTAAVKAR
jgi:hypothetical protein